MQSQYGIIVMLNINFNSCYAEIMKMLAHADMYVHSYLCSYRPGGLLVCMNSTVLERDSGSLP